MYNLKVEISSPSITSVTLPSPDYGSWYTSPVTAVVNGKSFSGITSCSSTTYSGTDSKTATVTGTCTDNAGKSVSLPSAQFQFEASTPTITSITLPSPDNVSPNNGNWYTHPVTATNVSGNSFSGIASCSSSTYSGTDSKTATVTGTCTDNAGKNVSQPSAQFQYEASTPTILVVPDRPYDSNGWYWSPVSAKVSGNAFSGISSCTSSAYSGPDSTRVLLTGSCVDNAGKPVGGSSTPFGYEASNPIITSLTLPSPDYGSWYTNPVTAAVSGKSFSGIASCGSTTYSGTDSKTATVTGTCDDNAGKTVTQASTPFQFEASAPTITSMSLPSPDNVSSTNGNWYTHPVTATNVSGNSFSGIASCSSSTYSGPDSKTATVTGTCNDNAGKTVRQSSAQFQYEATEPTISVGLPTPDVASSPTGSWYTNPVTAIVAGNSFSEIASCAPTSYSGADSKTATVNGTCTDNAGKTVSGTSAQFQYEASKPTISVSLPRPDNVSPTNGGWYTNPVTANVAGNSFSEIASCNPTTYSGADSKTATVSGTCVDNAGKTVSGTSAQFQYEASGPDVSISLPSPNRHGWYTDPVSAMVTGSSFSDIVSCTDPTYSGPNAPDATLTGNCTDNAGKTASATTAPFQYEGSGPNVSLTLSRLPDHDGWYTHPVSATVTATSVSGGVSCTQPTYSGPDSSNATVNASCTDNAGETTPTTSPAFRYEASGPTVSIALSRSPDNNGWYTSPVTAKLTGSSVSGGLSCSQPGYGGPDVTNATLTGSCTDNAGESGSATTEPLKYEASSPTISISLSRPPDANGWYNRVVSADVNGASFSGIASCTSPTYAGPDSLNATLRGSCIDNAGKTVSATTAAFRYDGSVSVQGFVADPADQIVVLHWSTLAVDPLSSIKITRRRGGSSVVVYTGTGNTFTDRHVRDGVTYQYTLVAGDQAGNLVSETLFVVPGARLLGPPPDAVVTAPPMLSWTPVRGASYYNIQLYQGRLKVLSSWPSNADLQLKTSWRFDAHRHRLGTGHYHWYVWPGFGPRRAARYGKMIGSGTFAVT